LARLPRRDDLGAAPSGRSGRPIATYDVSAIGKGAQALGRGIAQMGDAFASLESHNDAASEFETERRFQEFKFNEEKSLDKLQQDMQPGQADGFADRWAEGYKKSANEFYQGVPDKLKQKYYLRLFENERAGYRGAAEFGRTEQKRVAVNNLNDFGKRYAPRPGNLDVGKADYESLLERTPYLTPIEKDDFRRKGFGLLEEMYADHLIEQGQDPHQIRRDLGFGPDLDSDVNPEVRARPFEAPASGPGAASNFDALRNAVIQTESSGRPDLISNKGAVGLMQVMPDTAREIAGEIGDQRVADMNDEQLTAYLKNPEVSKQYGSHYLQKQIEAYGGDTEAALIAYNGGPKRADAWLAAGRDDKVIPKESANYYKKVLAQMGGEEPADGSKRVVSLGDYRGKQDPLAAAAQQATPPGTLAAVTHQSQRTFNAKGYGEKTTGSITVNGNTYEFVNGGSGRGSIPFGEYNIKRFTDSEQRAAEGFKYKEDAYELNDVTDDAPGTEGQDKRRGLLIHDGNRGITAGCIGIKGDFEQFQKDLGAEMEKNGGKPIKLRLGTPEQFGVASGGEGAPKETKVAQASSGTMTDAGSGTGSARLPGPQAATYSGPYQNLTAEQRLRLANKADAIIRQDIALTRQAVKSFDTMAEKGFAPNPREVDALRAKVESSRDPTLIQEYREAEAIMQWQNAARQTRPEELDAFIRSETDRVAGKGATPFDVRRIDVADKLLNNMRKELKEDPLGWADRVGLVKVEPIDFASPEAAQASLEKRIAQADEVTKRYGTETRYLRPDEKHALVTAVEKGGDQTLAVTGMIATTAGNRAPAILGEIFKESPVAAVIGGVVAETGMSPAARDAADGLALSKEPGFQSVAPSIKEARTRSVEILGAALSGMPKTESAFINAANHIYNVRARKQGLTDFDATVWQQGLRELVGERSIGGKTYGGIVDANPSMWGTRNIILPSFMAQDGWRDAVEALQMKDFEVAGLGLPAGRNGDMIPISRVKGATLVQVGDGRYALSLGDPDVPGEEKWVVRHDAPGELFELDFRRMRPRLEARRPDLFLSDTSFDMRNPETRPFMSGEE
jgi:hypothetical protein